MIVPVEPSLVSAPAPEIIPANVALDPLVKRAPPPLLSVSARAVVKPPATLSVPPSMVSPPATLPRRLSEATVRVPALMNVPPVVAVDARSKHQFAGTGLGERSGPEYRAGKRRTPGSDIDDAASRT
jgi:hypothetical protein